MRFTAILVRWQDGWRWVESAEEPRIETCQGHSGDGAEVIHKASAELATYKFGQTEITVGIDPAAGDPVPGMDWTVGDEVEVDGSFREVETLTVTIDDDTGRVSAVPQFGDIIDSPAERVDQNLAAIGGLNKGSTHLGRPVDSLPPPNLKPA